MLGHTKKIGIIGDKPYHEECCRYLGHKFITKKTEICDIGDTLKYLYVILHG
jgi:hypothetical protein